MPEVEQEKGEEDSVGGIAGDEQTGRQASSPGVTQPPGLPQTQQGVQRSQQRQGR